MRFNLYHKLLLLLMVVILVALSSSLVLRSLVIRDFKAFGEGRMLDRVYQIQAVLEGRYEQAGSWSKDRVRDDLVRVWQSGLELRLFDSGNRLILDTELALKELPPVMQQRVMDSSSRRPPVDSRSPFQSYPLFLNEEEIGHIEIRLPQPVHEAFFITASNRFLLFSTLGLGLIALVLSFLMARRISRPLQQLTDVAERMAAGEPGEQVDIKTKDEIGRLGQSFNRMSAVLAAQERLRRQLVSNAAHELRTPLMIIRGELEAMIDGVLPTTPESLQSLHDEAGRLAAILDGVDELTRAQAASMHLELQDMPLMPFVRQVVGMFSRQAEEQNIAICFLGDQTVIVAIDPEKFTRIIINLTTNAIRSMPDGGTLSFEVKQVAQGVVKLMVHDTGCGIAEDKLSHIFERFYKGKHGGLGLGLAIVKELVESHGGVISVESKLGVGTTFTIEMINSPGGSQ